jgi:hypothetical protein
VPREAPEGSPAAPDEGVDTSENSSDDYPHLGALKMPMFLLFVSIFGGIATFGTWGAILGPLIVRLLMEALVLRSETVGATNASLASKE